MRRLAGLLVLLACAAPMTAREAHAQVTVGTGTPYNGTCGPFTCGIGRTRYQQVYSADFFAGPLRITSLTFPGLPQGNPWYGVPIVPASATFTLYLGVTSRAVDGLSTDLASNVTGPQQFFIRFPFPGTPYNNAALRFDGVGFDYDPAAGNLLLDVRIEGEVFNTGCGCLMASNIGTGTSIAFDRFNNVPGATYETATARSGAVTIFNAAATTVPEPSTYALLGTGLAVLGLTARRRVRA